MAANIDTGASFTQHLKETENRLKEFGSFISSVASHEPINEIFEQIKHIDNEIDIKLKNLESAMSNNQKAVHELEAEKEELSRRISLHKINFNLSQDEYNHLLKERTLMKNVPDNEIKELKIKQLEAEDLMFRKHLGMEIRKMKGGCLQVAFSQIDQNQPSSLFLFSLKLDENRQYIITDCKPPIADLDDIVHKLNNDNDFRNFIRTMRRKFKESIA